ncbi:hypothetical protein A2715_03860 [Candidatus Woesebacteria bacterium RIFCSPHIGHO2_01_FULL_39_32]|uniref:PrgI family protein n=1 Tax=Candidatus Woesebacteria bacterium RIFCSPLOWO2_01_FULL_39_25 TaxID=1802521 RepID=A0A1F8BKU2_9BACT|nr:MAG: hypothetical protein A2124_03035 [Candidatus Woesebacteria bacterium GWB1_37_5]OGM25050.1 MAG: hypothetical protein A2715_03860 [Candidatus Woesebacteria bacterium RIFCSPHIGHO2_01_FULL_39_32]OGM35540.1 MAG: hypothetical protein A3F01_05100 [Candidatus Woesebacteria bacterium RIFCSPHIGHO2_12_FULL_38_11]OGM63965.1 MAG: hypothetical protein A2893_00450 [Candidatus Woesebacteria bacterium RIFCSPLOWO2_01_FULL_39_25]
MELEEQHPIPQQISAYQFRLVGDMTIKQFFQVAGGALVALLVYTSNAASYVKWPLIILSFLTGIAFAFFPLQDRPLSTWIFLFIKSIYSPTLYVWRKGQKKQNFFSPEPGTTETQISIPRESTPVMTPAPELKNLEEKESAFLSSVTQQLASVQGISPQSVTLPEPPSQEEKVPASPIITVSQEEKARINETPEATPQPTNISTLTPSVGKKIEGVQVAQFSQEAAPPSPPTKPNVIVGQVVDPSGGIIEAAILEIRDSEGRPVRALKSNKLGHFMIVTPLLNGMYEIITEKEGYTFEPITLEAKGEIIPPIAIWSKKQSENLIS